MGLERVLQATGRLAVVVVATFSVAHAAPDPDEDADAAEVTRDEKVAVIDVGPDVGALRLRITKALVVQGLNPLVGDGVEDALAGIDAAPDAAQLAAAMRAAELGYGQLHCPSTLEAATRAIGIAAARQASGLAAPELVRAWSYLLLCAPSPQAARTAIDRLRTLGGEAVATGVPAELWAKYPEVDATLDGERFAIEITADVAGAAIWIDHQRAGTSPLKTTLRAGDHVIAAAAPGRRGFAMGTAVKAQTTLAIPTTDQRSRYSAIAKRVASWGGITPAASEVKKILDALNVRAALVRSGNNLEVWGRPGTKGEPRKLGGEDGNGTIDEVDRLGALIRDRVRHWDDGHDPDAADVPLLTESDVPERTGPKDEPTKWWIYATIGGALLGGAALLYATESATAHQRVELTLP